MTDELETTRVTFTVPEFFDREIKKERELSDTKMAAIAKALELEHANQSKTATLRMALVAIGSSVAVGVLLHFVH